MKHICRFALLILILFISPLTISGVENASAQDASENVVRVVLFFSPTCPHCEKVIKEDLPPLKQQYGDRLLILGIDISQPQGLQMYQSAVKAFSVPNNRLGVPTMIVADQVLVGSVEIPEQLPGLIEQYLTQGGIAWPAIPGLEGWLAQGDTAQTETPGVTETLTAEASGTPPPTPVPTRPRPTPTATEVPPFLLSFESSQKLLTNFKNDQPANSIALVVLAGMILTVAVVPFAIARPLLAPVRGWVTWFIPLLSLAGLAVAAYLSYVEVKQVSAVCWPIGECNQVQQSAYAWVGGVLPVGVLGLAGYGGLLLAWLVSRVKLCWLSRLAAAGIIGMALFGTLFSIVLTFLEPFVIGATCVWCLISAVLVTILFILSVPYYWGIRRLRNS
jgi:uncharacterized membrane protein/thiol-disulfide isomerase/thioredoxin